MIVYDIHRMNEAKKKKKPVERVEGNLYSEFNEFCAMAHAVWHVRIKI